MSNKLLRGLFNAVCDLRQYMETFDCDDLARKRFNAGEEAEYLLAMNDAMFYEIKARRYLNSKRLEAGNE